MEKTAVRADCGFFCAKGSEMMDGVAIGEKGKIV